MSRVSGSRKDQSRKVQPFDAPFPFTTAETGDLVAHLSTIAYEKGYSAGFAAGVEYAKRKRVKVFTRKGIR